jgi:hypothetical protein
VLISDAYLKSLDIIGNSVYSVYAEL